MNTIELTKELSQNFLDFSHEVNYQRAFADARDGLKPGQRACIWEMYQKGYKSNKPHVKSAKISGGVIANWWPHGDTAIYETFARMSQKWINNIPEIDWHGANGSVQISGEPAASRYTEARLTKIVEEGMLANIDKNTVPMKPNFSDDDKWPVVLPAVFPRLMVNGCQGIGSTIANVWLPHSFTEIANIIDKYISTGEIDYNNIAPSFPSGGIIINKKELPIIYKTGKGKVILRGRAEIKNNYIIITEIPYQVYVEPLIEEIKKYAVEEENSGIEDVINKSSKNICIEIECSSNPAAILKKLYSKTSLQKSFNANQYALTDKGIPALLTLKDYLDIYVNHNIKCIINETKFDLNKAIDRLEIVNGLLRALEDIDNIIALIKGSESAAAAKENLIKKYQFTENQAKAILAMRLSSLAKLEKVELEQEAKELENKIKDLKDILANEDRQKDILKSRLADLVKKYGDKRRTELTQLNLTEEEKAAVKIAPQDVVVILTQDGNIKRIPKTSFRVQHRNTKGIKTLDRTVISTISTNTLDTLLIFTSKGLMHRIKVNDIPEGTNSTGGQNITLMSKIAPDEEIQASTSMNQNTNMKYVVFFTKNGLVKKTCMEEYTQMKKSTGIQAIKFKSEDDKLVNVEFMNDEDIILITKNGIGIRFVSTDIAAIGRVTCGVKGINLKEDEVIAGIPVNKDSTCKIAIFSKQGYGKLLKINEFSTQGRGGRGVFVFKPDQKSGDIVAAALMGGDEDTLLISGKPNSVVIAAKEISTQGKAASGVKIIEKSQIERVIKL